MDLIPIVGMMIPIIGTICVFTFLTIIIVTKRVHRSRERQKAQEIIQTAIEKGEKISPELLAVLTPPTGIVPNAQWDLRTGVILVGVGLGLAILGLVLGNSHDGDLHPLIGVAAIPFLIGVGLIVLSYLNPNKTAPK
jgi:hypothetical protein